MVTYINQGARQAAARDQVVKIHSYFEAIEVRSASRRLCFSPPPWGFTDLGRFDSEQLLSPTRRLVREGLMTWVKGKEKNPVRPPAQSDNIVYYYYYILVLLLLLLHDA